VCLDRHLRRQALYVSICVVSCPLGSNSGAQNAIVWCVEFRFCAEPRDRIVASEGSCHYGTSLWSMLIKPHLTRCSVTNATISTSSSLIRKRTAGSENIGDRLEWLLHGVGKSIINSHSSPSSIFCYHQYYQIITFIKLNLHNIRVTWCFTLNKYF
jgi:hypothetical protein